MMPARRVFVVASAVAAFSGTLTAVACAHGARAAPLAGAPRLMRLLPDAVALVPGNVTEVELRGSGFDVDRSSPGNTVIIGRLHLTNVPANADGTSIKVVVPDGEPSGGEAPPRPWNGGKYPVVVRTARGTSDTLFLTIGVERGMRP